MDAGGSGGGEYAGALPDDLRRRLLHSVFPFLQVLADEGQQRLGFSALACIRLNREIGLTTTRIQATDN